MIVLKRPYISHAHTRFLFVPAHSPPPSSDATVHAQKWKICFPKQKLHSEKKMIG